MADVTSIDQNRVQVVKDDEITFDTHRPSITLFPDNQRIVHTNWQIDFPSLIQARAYYRNVIDGGSYCELWSTLFWQEWGPFEAYRNENYYSQAPQNSIPGPTTRTLPQQSLGFVPGASNFLDIRVRLTRTVTPPPFGGHLPPIMFFPQGEWINLGNGGSCPVEFFPPMIRHFDIVREGNEVFLRRYQSVKNTNSLLAPGGNPQANIAVNQSGWNSLNQKLVGVSSYSDGTDGAQLNPYSNTELAILINQRGPSGGNSRRPNSGQDECAGGWPDLRSLYSADIIITPGLYRGAA